jgi:DNA-binding MarR family transcriptional regulator
MGIRPATSADESTGRLADGLLRLTRRLHRAQRRHLEPLGLTPAQARLLRSVAQHTERAGNAGDSGDAGDAPPRMADLAARLDVVPRAVTTLVDAVEERGLVRREADPASRRVVRIRLTPAGAEAVRALRDARRAAAEELLAPLDAGQRSALAGLLDTLEGGAAQGPHCPRG